MKEYVSEIEKQVIDSKEPIKTNIKDTTTIDDQTGLWLNKDECLDWSGQINLNDYPINKDDSPIVINKPNGEKIEQSQQVFIRYLRPPTPEPEEIIIREEPCVQEPPAPPLVIRQEGKRPKTPEPIVYREYPPEPPKKTEKKIITIPGKKIGPVPRKIVVEKMPNLPAKPPDIIIEKWLPYPSTKQKIVYEKSCNTSMEYLKNELIEWQTPLVRIEPVFHDLGTYKIDPETYKSQYGFSDMKKYENFKNDQDYDVDFDYLEEIGIDELFVNQNFYSKTEYQDDNIYEFFPHWNQSLSRNKQFFKSEQEMKQQSLGSLYEQLNETFINNSEQKILVYHENKSDEMKCVKYSDVKNEIYELGNGLMSLGFGADQDAKIGFYTSDRLECTLFDLCCGLFSFIRVPIHKKTSINEISKILNDSKLSVAVCDNSYMAIDLMQNNSNLKLIIILEQEIENYAIDRAKTLNIHLINFERIKEIGRKNQCIHKFQNNLHSIYYKQNNANYDAVLTNSSIAHANTLIKNKLKESCIFLVPNQEVYYSGQSSWSIINAVIQILILRNNGSIAFSPSNSDNIYGKIVRLNPTIAYLNQNQIRTLFDKLNKETNSQRKNIKLKLIFTDSVIHEKEIVNFFEKIDCKIIEIISGLEDLSISQNNPDVKISIHSICDKMDADKLRSYDDKLINNLEKIYQKGNLVRQIFIFSENNYLSAAVVPNQDYIQNLAHKYNLSFDFTRLCKNPSLNKIILSELDNKAQEFNLAQNEKIKIVFLHHELFGSREDARSRFQTDNNSQLNI